MKRVHWAGLGLVVVVAGVMLSKGCSPAPDPWKDTPGSPRIVVTIPPLYSFVRAVGGKDVAIRSLCTTTGPHHYETDYRDARLLDGADGFFSIGLQLDDKFADALPRLSRAKERVEPFKLGEHLKKQGLVRKMPKDDHDKSAGGHQHGEYDPHVWLGIEQAVAMVKLIRDEMVRIDEKHAERYRKNAGAYVKTLQTLHARGKAMLEGKKVKRIISFHDALQYFAASFGLEIADVIEIGPGDNPAPGHLAHLVELCRNPSRPVGAITVEPQYPEGSSAGTVLGELKSKGITVEMVKVDPLETGDPDELKEEGATWYEERMSSNLKALAGALK
jgi:ABC-type Zn uptake system ZnuABC Zn-binding protein ZnuA